MGRHEIPSAWRRCYRDGFGHTAGPIVLDLNDFIAEIRDTLQRLIGEDIQTAVQLDADSSLIQLDAGQLTQIVMNLAANARDAMPTGEKLSIETRTVEREREDLGRRGIRPAGRFVLLAVTDTCQGIDARTQAHLFEQFFTTKSPEKVLDSGWPQSTALLRSSPIEVEATLGESIPKRTGTILLAEDQSAIRLLAEDVLSEAGHKVLSAGNGRAALELSRPRLAAPRSHRARHGFFEQTLSSRNAEREGNQLLREEAGVRGARQ